MTRSWEQCGLWKKLCHIGLGTWTYKYTIGGKEFTVGLKDEASFVEFRQFCTSSDVVELMLTKKSGEGRKQLMLKSPNEERSHENNSKG